METIIRPQPGPQEAFLASPADIAIYGGAAFGGKTFALLLEAVRHTAVANFGGVVFRRTTKQVTAEGGLWDTSEGIFSRLGARPNISRLSWGFPAGAKITFAHMEHEKNKFDWQGSQIAFLGFDELTHFTAGQFWYLLSRNRSVSGVRPYVRATCNPDPESFVADLIAWWIDAETGYAIPERGGVVRWFVRVNDALVWGDSREELTHRFPGSTPKSLTFIPSSYADNRIGLERDPGYLANLEALPRVERERLKAGNWKIRPDSGECFKKGWFEVVEQPPVRAQRVRYWDRAATEPSDSRPDPDYTCGLRLSRGEDGTWYVEDVERFRGTPGKVMRRIAAVASQDGVGVTIGIEQDPGQAGVVEVEAYVRALAGYAVKTPSPSGSKETRAGPVSAQAEHGMIKLVRGAWNDEFLAELEMFPKGGHDDQVDALSGAFGLLATAVPWSAEWRGTNERRMPWAGDFAGHGGDFLTDTGFGTVRSYDHYHGY